MDEEKWVFSDNKYVLKNIETDDKVDTNNKLGT